MTTAFTKRLGIAFVVLASVLVAGWFLLSRVLEPREPRQLLLVTTTSAGRSPLEMESAVTTLIEHALSQLTGVTSVRSESRAGESQVTVAFEGEDFTFGQAARDVLAKTQRQLPEGAFPQSRFNAVEPVEERYLVRSDTMDSLTLSRWVKEVLVRALEVQVGVRQVEVCGALEQTRVVTLDSQKLRAYGISVRDALRAIELSRENDDVKLGPVSLRDVARVELTGVPDACRAWLDGAPAQVVTVTRFVEGETKLPMPPPDVSMKRVEGELGGIYRSTDQPPATGLVLQRGRELISFTAQPSLQLIRKPKSVVVRVFGEDLAVLRTVATSLHDAVKDAQWLGAVTPGEDVLTRTVKMDPEAAGMLRLQLAGTTVKLDDETPVAVTESLGPEVVLHVDLRRVFEFDVGASERDVKRAIEPVALPVGVVITTSSRSPLR